MRLVATWKRWAIGAGALAAGFVLAVGAFGSVTHAQQTMASYGTLIAAFVVVESLLVLAALRSEEARLKRELRTARTGTPALRGLLVGRRQRTPFISRLFSTRLGTAAVLLAEGERSAALEALSGGSPLMHGGRLDLLRQIIDADAERATGTSVGLERCVGRLYAMGPLGHHEADLYRTHVHVKALLQQGDPEGGLELARKLLSDPDHEARIYAVWLRVWFDLEAEVEEASAWPAITEGDLRVATLLARSQGAEKLIELLDVRLASVAPTAGR